MTDTLPFSAHLTADGRYVNIRIPADRLPRELRSNPARMNVRLLPESRLPSRLRRWIPAYLLALKSS